LSSYRKDNRKAKGGPACCGQRAKSRENSRQFVIQNELCGTVWIKSGMDFIGTVFILKNKKSTHFLHQIRNTNGLVYNSINLNTLISKNLT
jgi:hypothetical protein